MFASLASKSNGKTSDRAASKNAVPPAPRTLHWGVLGASPIRHAARAEHSFPGAIGNQAMLRLLAQSRPAQNPSRQASSRPQTAFNGSASALPGPIQAKLIVGRVDDPLEAEADRTADQVMSARQPGPSTPAPALRLSRKCAACEEEKGEKLHAKQSNSSAPSTAAGIAPSTVNSVLASPGRTLAHDARAFLEPRFGRSFAGLRIHDGPQAARSAADVGARAYTVGQNIVFGAAEYRPHDHSGMWLLAHEVAHTIQQAGGAGPLARACLPNNICNPPAPAAGAPAPEKTGSEKEFVADTESKPANKSKRDIRAAACAAPTSPACLSGGHGRRATNVTKFVTDNLPSRKDAPEGFFVDMDMPPEWGAYTYPCASFTPPITSASGKECVFVPNNMETEAGQYNGGAATVGGKTRLLWSQETQASLTHETEHALFATSEATPGPASVKDPANLCSFDANSGALTELAAFISEFKPILHKAQGLTGAAREANIDWWLNFLVFNSEGIFNSVIDMRCKCDCDPVNSYINRIFTFATQGWNKYEMWIFNTKLRDPKWKKTNPDRKLDWPVKPPDSVPADELPSAGATMDPADLPKAKP